MENDTDLTGLDPGAAREYVLGYITALRITGKKRQRMEASLKTWEERIKQATEAGNTTLRDTARNEMQRIQDGLGRVAFEESELSAQVEVMKRHLKSMQHGPVVNADAEALLAQLQSITGEPDTLKSDLNRLGAEQRADEELEALKRRMAKGE
ncbi:MAG: hypothetical protein OXC12_19680 [Spirochaetaceae bacterium]|nr:hypothetical protein [Spirochaetaceae bacterium]